jgi:hypothetical protein
MARTLSNEELTEMVINLNERVERLSQELYELAPEKEIIDTVYEGPERQAAIDAYMGHGSY